MFNCQAHKYFLLPLFLTMIIVLSTGGDIMAQDNTGKLKRKAEMMLKKGDIYGAIPIMERYCIKKPKDIKAAYELAHNYKLIRDYSKAADWYLKVYEADNANHREALYYHAKMLKMSGANQSALKSFLEFKAIYKGFDADRSLKKLTDAEIIGCQMADSLIQNSIGIMVHLMDTSINKIYSEFSPYLINDSTLLYASLPINKLMDAKDKQPAKRFYTASKYEYHWTGGQSFEGPFNDDKYTTGNGCYSPDGNRFYFTRCQYNFDSQLICSIFKSTKKEGVWSDPEKLGSGINSATYTNTHPAVGKDPKTPNREILYFISNRPDGEGGYDIWFSSYDKRYDEYDEPRNIGRKLNTVGDEYSLFADNVNSRLYFASDGWPGIGGFDLFKTSGYKKKWTEPVNLGYPFNSNADDLYFTRGKETKDGFLVSNRKGGLEFSYYNCCDDIYEFRWKEYINVFVRGSVNPKTEDGDTTEIPELIDPIVSLYVFDEVSGEQILLRSDTIIDGNFELELEPGEVYQVMVEAENFLNRSFHVSTIDYYLSDTLNFDFRMEVVPDKPIVLKDIHFGFDDHKLNQSVMNYLDSTLYQTLYDNPDIKVEIAAHTDGKGDDAYNKKLSQRRASSVMDYLVQKGIKQAKLIAKGYGEARPIAPNKNEDGTDNPEGRALNRRVEFEILK